MLKHLPSSAKDTLLGVLNNIWSSGNFPAGWCTSTVIPVLKPGKEGSDPGSYRPISLTSCICKIMERMINDRLVWYCIWNQTSCLLLFSAASVSVAVPQTTLFALKHCQRSLCTTATLCGCIFRSRKGLRYYVEIWNHERLT